MRQPDGNRDPKAPLRLEDVGSEGNDGARLDNESSTKKRTYKAKRRGGSGGGRKFRELSLPPNHKQAGLV